MPLVDFYRGTETTVRDAGPAGGFLTVMVRLSDGFSTSIFAPTQAAAVTASHVWTDIIHDYVSQTLSAPLPFGKRVGPWLAADPEIIVTPPPPNWAQILTHLVEVRVGSGDPVWMPAVTPRPPI